MLDSTGVGGSNGGLTVTGNGSFASGGRVTHKSGPDGNPLEGVGYYFRSTKNPTLSWVWLDEFTNAAIVGRDVAGFTMSDSYIDGNNGSAVGANEGAIIFGAPNPAGFNGVTGAVTLTNNSINGAIEHNAAFYNQSGALTLVVRRTSPTPGDCQFSFTSGTTAGTGLRVHAEGTATSTVTVDQCRFRDDRLSGLLATAADNAALSLTVTGSEFVRGSIGQQGLVMRNSGNADLTTTVSNNIFVFLPGAGIQIGQEPGNASAQSLLQASILSNNFETSSNPTAPSILARLSSTVGQVSQTRLRIADNGRNNAPPRLNQYGLPPGIRVETPDAGTTPQVDVTMTDNHVDLLLSDTNTRGPNGTELRMLNGSGCSNLLNNISHNYPLGQSTGGGINVTQSGGATLALERGSAALGASAATVLDVNSTDSETPTAVIGTVTVVENGSCVLPATP
jgi:hypothetical protein